MSPRTLNTAVDAERLEFTYLYEINHSGGTIFITNASRDIVALGETWTAVGGALLQGPVSDMSDRKAQGVELSLWGVSQTIIALIQLNQFRGRTILIYLVGGDPDTGAFTTPDLIFRGRQNSDYKITEERDHDSTTSGGSVVVKTRISSDLSQINTKMSCRCSVPSHQAYLSRAGLDPDDDFFERTLSIMNTAIYWGTENPDLPEPTPQNIWANRGGDN
ncbi:hypothetical protein LCGC14_0686170 [marine sediment metagenome]|uniref:Uncharacterized protein n=1 Tax=marine sediment metagenome TaxID=412755 RepID=A0A0F9QLS5_9ZZZZ